MTSTLDPYPSLPSLGKQKISISDSMESSKSISISDSMEQCEITPHLIAEPLLELLPGAAPSDASVKFDLFQPIILDVGEDNVGSNLPTGMETELSMEMVSFEVVQHLYVPGLISGLEDCPFLPECTEIG